MRAYWQVRGETTQELATNKMIAWMESKWHEDLIKLACGVYSFGATLERIGDRAARDILATRYWDGKRKCKKCGALTDRWFRGNLCRECYFEEN